MVDWTEGEGGGGGGEGPRCWGCWVCRGWTRGAGRVGKWSLFIVKYKPASLGQKSVKKLRRFLFLCCCRCLVTFVVVDDDGLQPLTNQASAPNTMKKTAWGCCISLCLAFLLLAKRPLVRFSAFPMLSRFIDHTLLRQRIVQSLIVDETHLVLVSGKLVLQKEVSLIDSRSVWNSCSWKIGLWLYKVTSYCEWL